jgi:hypothetical protein
LAVFVFIAGQLAFGARSGVDAAIAATLLLLLLLLGSRGRFVVHMRYL